MTLTLRPPAPARLAHLRPTDLVLAAAGVVPVSLIALSTFGLDLRGMALHVALPVVCVVAVVAAGDGDATAAVRAAVRSGVGATAL